LNSRYEHPADSLDQKEVLVSDIGIAIALERFTTFGDLLKYLRRRTGLTQRELSIAVGYSDAQISRLEQNQRLPDLATLTARFLPVLMLEEHPDAAERLLELAANMRREDAPATGLAPYKGLYFFDEPDADLFFGREELTASLIDRLTSGLEHDQRFLAVIGASGSGKSSVVRAGLIPTLRWRKPSSGWLIDVITPTAHPLETLANAFDAFAPLDKPVQEISSGFLKEAQSLDQFSAHIAEASGAAHTLLVVDQFEELFTLCRSETEQSAFIENLLNAALTPSGTGIILIAMRADFYAPCARFDSLRQALAHHQEYIGPMSSEELRKAIEEPARHGHWEIESGLVDLMLHDVGADTGSAPEPGALPLLSHALLETWQHRRGRTLTLSGYSAAGGVRGAIAETAEAVFHDQLALEERTIARQIFLRLTELGDDDATADTRRRVSFDELVSKPEEGDAIRQVLLTLADARLITTEQNSVEVAHEALIREWPTLRAWLQEGRDSLRLHRHLTEAAQEWENTNHDPSELYRGARLAGAIEWADEHPDDLNNLEQDFLEASQALAEKEIKEREEQRQRELEAARKVAEEQARSAKLQRSRALWLTGFSLFAIILAVFAFVSRASARREAAVNHSLVLANSATDAFDNGDSDLALGLALEAVDINQPPAEALLALSEIAMGPGTRAVLEGHHHAVRAVAFSPDGQMALSGSCGKSDPDGTCSQGELILWDLKNTSEVRRFSGHTDWVNGVAFSPDGQTALSASGDGRLILWDIETGSAIRHFEGHTGGVNGVVFGPDSQSGADHPTALSASDDSSLILWNLASGEVLRRFNGHSGGVKSVTISPFIQTGEGAPMLALSGSEDTSIILWDLGTGEVVHHFEGHTSQIIDLAFTPDGNAFLSTANDQSLRLWSIESGEQIDQEIFSGGANFLAISPDGRTVVHGHNFEVQIRDIQQWQRRGRLLGHSDLSSVKSIAISPDGSLILSGADDGSLRLWNLEAQAEIERFQISEMLFSMAVSPDGERLLMGDVNGEAILWDIEGGEVIRRFKGGDYPVTPGGVAFSPDGRLALVITSDIFGGSGTSSLVLWDTETGEEVQRFKEHVTYARSAAFSPDGRTVLSGSQSLDGSMQGDLLLWDAETGQVVRRFETTEDITRIVFNADGSRALTGSAYFANARLWDVGSGQEINQFEGAVSLVFGVAFGPDERTVLTGSQDGNLTLWDVETGQIVRRYLGHQSGVWSVDASPDIPEGTDRRYIISGSEDGVIILWDFDTGEELHRFRKHTAWIPDLAFSPDGQTAFSVSLDGTLIQWQITDLPLNELISWIDENRYLRELTCDERTQYNVAPFCE
jgi:WD40 repeat protein